MRRIKIPLVSKLLVVPPLAFTELLTATYHPQIMNVRTFAVDNLSKQAEPRKIVSKQLYFTITGIFKQEATCRNW